MKQTSDSAALAQPRRQPTAMSWKTPLQALGSLRITVALLSLGLVVVLVGTLQQTRADISDVKAAHFSQPVVYIPFQTLLPPAWFPNLQSVGGVFMLPSGATILVALLVNLIAAHLSRFRVQASGARLLLGLAQLGVGLAITALVLINGNVKGFQDEPLIPWPVLWVLMQVGLGGVVLGCIAGAVALGQGRTTERVSLIGMATILGLLLGYLIYQGESGFIGDYAMRIMWRLLQGVIAALVVYLGCAMVFRRKAGIVVIHAGVLMLMVGELYTTYSAVEQRMSLLEGESASHTVNIDAVEMAVLQENSDGTQRVIAVPASRLKQLGTVDDQRLPFRIRTLEYFDNSTLESVRRSGDSAASKGIGTMVLAEPAAPVTGTDTEQGADFASAYVQLLDDGGRDLGTYLISQELYRRTDFDLDTVEVDGQSYQIGLRFEHIYKPYTIELIDTNRDNYVGTQIAQTYSSEFKLIDATSDIDAIKKISMNNPLRYNNETFYQSGHDFDARGREFSVLQIVQNTGWMIPYVSWGFVAVGLIAHFLMTFIGFLGKDFSNEPRGSLSLTLWLVLAFQVIFSLYTLSRTVPRKVELVDPKVEVEGLRLDRLAKMPVVYGGRVQPLDSLARTTLRQLRKRETATDFKGDTQPAIKWIADVMFGDDAYRDYRVFRVDDPEVAAALGLRRRKGFLYSLREIEERSAERERLLEVARETEERRLTNLQKKIIKLNDQLQLVYGIRFSFDNLAARYEDNPLEGLGLLQAVVRSPVPLSVPDETEAGWSPMSVHLARQWIGKMARNRGVTTSAELSQRIADEYLRDELVARQLTDKFLQSEDLPSLGLDEARLREAVDQMIANPPDELKDVLRSFMQQIEPTVTMQLVQVAQLVDGQIKAIMPPELGVDLTQVPQDFPSLATMQAAYHARDAANFHTSLDEFISDVSRRNLKDVKPRKLNAELFYNRFSPFYIATVVYLAAVFVGLLAWLFMVTELYDPVGIAFRRAAFGLAILAFVIHFGGLGLRMYIHGRPPTTNLYSSAILVGLLFVALGIGFERLTRLGIGNLLSGLFGFLSLMIAFSLSLDGDTFSVLVAVLDTQFWLATHVVCICCGYSATLFAGSLGIAYVIATLCTPFANKTVRQVIIKAIYGVTCFALILSFVGTLLGGLWADDSWGRFWGWDPKENGALMIVLANAILLHARWAGLVRETGIAVLAIMANIVTVWSWFAVNELGIGLHSYGFSEGRMLWVAIVALLHLLFIATVLVPRKYWWSLAVSARAGEKPT